MQADGEARTAQVGPIYSAEQVIEVEAQRVVEDDLHTDITLLRLEMPDGTLGFPAWQFEEAVRPGVRAVVAELLAVVVTPWMIANWLTEPQPAMGGRTPLAALRDDADVDRVVTAARQATHAWSQ